MWIWLIPECREEDEARLPPRCPVQKHRNSVTVLCSVKGTKGMCVVRCLRITFSGVWRRFWCGFVFWELRRKQTSEVWSSNVRQNIVNELISTWMKSVLSPIMLCRMFMTTEQCRLDTVSFTCNIVRVYSQCSEWMCSWNKDFGPILISGKLRTAKAILHDAQQNYLVRKLRTKYFTHEIGVVVAQT
jgi:hypothetical protein